jgi:hypothetical protein
MDKEIRSIKKTMGKKLDALAKEDKKRDPACDYGAKHMPKKKKK